MFEATVTINLKKGVSDPEGANTLKALHLLGFNNVSNVKTTRVIHIYIDGRTEKEINEKTEQMCQRLLTNPVIHTYSIQVKEKKE